MHTTGDATAAARTQLGYHEGESAGHWNNIQKYAPVLGFANGQAWCDTFANFIFWLVGATVPPGAKSAGCLASVAAYKKAGRWTLYPVVGAQVFYGTGGGEHTGIVIGYDDTNVTAIEGNTNTNGSAEGDGVYQKVRARRSPYVYGYGIPYYKSTGHSPDPHWQGRDLSK
jgi:hypothetical protein